jgi:hypothetical protein
LTEALPSCSGAPTFAHKILKGAKPADLPVEQPMRFELAVNMKTAKALGLAFPTSIMIRADQVIQYLQRCAEARVGESVLADLRDASGGRGQIVP